MARSWISAPSSWPRGSAAGRTDAVRQHGGRRAWVAEETCGRRRSRDTAGGVAPGGRRAWVAEETRARRRSRATLADWHTLSRTARYRTCAPTWRGARGDTSAHASAQPARHADIPPQPAAHADAGRGRSLGAFAWRTIGRPVSPPTRGRSIRSRLLLPVGPDRGRARRCRACRRCGGRARCSAGCVAGGARHSRAAVRERRALRAS